MAASVSSQNPNSLIVSVCRWTAKSLRSAAIERAVDHRRRRAEVLVDLDPERAARHRFLDGAGIGAAAAQKAEVQAVMVGGPDDCPSTFGPGAAHVEVRARAHADHRGDAARQRVVALLGGQKVGVALDPARRDDVEVAVNDRGVRARPQAGVDAVHDVRIAGLADADDAPVADADVGLHDAEHGIDDGGVLDDHVERARGIGAAGLEALAVAHGLAGAGRQLVAVDGEVVLDLGQKEVSPRRTRSPVVGPYICA